MLETIRELIGLYINAHQIELDYKDKSIFVPVNSINWARSTKPDIQNKLEPYFISNICSIIDNLNKIQCNKSQTDKIIHYYVSKMLSYYTGKLYEDIKKGLESEYEKIVEYLKGILNEFEINDLL